MKTFTLRSLATAALAICVICAPVPATAFETPAGSAAAFFSQERRSRVVSLNQHSLLQQQLPESTRMLVGDPTGMGRGAITVDTKNRYLYLSLGDGQAIRYGVGVGREGFEWRGTAKVGRKAEWPSWVPPAEMLKRRPDLPTYMEGGLDNPLGARALYLYNGKRDTMFRIHGTNEPGTIGQAVSSGCIRMMNSDVADLYNRVRIGTTVRVL